ncbi:hypothetical protein T492DRAFT_901803 [Pavlovales sp. CCMP2436]|nr:hypothetical protein T492DRAFT_901803 [Pavlovales sp. CCMP2436]
MASPRASGGMVRARAPHELTRMRRKKVKHRAILRSSTFKIHSDVHREIALYPSMWCASALASLLLLFGSMLDGLRTEGAAPVLTQHTLRDDVQVDAQHVKELCIGGQLA